MAEKSDQSAPAKCGKCSKVMSTPLVCDYCHALFPQSASRSDYFEMLGVPRTFDVDEATLHERFLALNRHAHPDQHANEPPEVQRLSLSVSATVNDAYRTLKDPARRAAYLLELLGGHSSADDRAVPEGFLGTMMMMQEELQEAKAAGDAGELRRLGEVLATQHDGLVRRIAGLFAELEPAIACNAVHAEMLGEIRKQINAVSYVRKLRTSLD